MTTLDTAASADGLLMVPAERGPWEALRNLHGAMADLRGMGLAPELTFVHTLARDGRLVHGRHPDAAAFILGYKLSSPN
ncbi:MAG: hypothetical protein ACRDH9_10155 [Actinomycetota bacterium]